MEPTPANVTIPAYAGLAPFTSMAHLGRSAISQMHYFYLLLATIFLAGCASHDLDGTWTFDSQATRKLISQSSALSPDTIEHLIKTAYKPHKFYITGDRYKMLAPDGISEGSIRIRRLSENSFKVTMTCVGSPPGDTAIVKLEDFGLSYTSLTPLFTGERTAYTLERAEQLRL
jgi:hypothetical protein